MRTVAEIINALGGVEALKARPLRIEVPGFMQLCVESVGTGPRGFEQISICHYFEQGGDLVQDPDLVVEVIPDARGMVPPDVAEWGIVSIQHPYGPVVRACWADESGRVMVNERLVRDIREFARTWDHNIREQGFLEAFRARSGE